MLVVQGDSRSAPARYWLMHVNQKNLDATRSFLHAFTEFDEYFSFQRNWLQILLAFRPGVFTAGENRETMIAAAGHAGKPPSGSPPLAVPAATGGETTGEGLWR